MSIRFFLVDGTMQERYLWARRLQIELEAIRLINSPKDIYGFQGGEIIFGQTGQSEGMSDILAYARTHDIRTFQDS